MQTAALGAALEREHREIDHEIEAFRAGTVDGESTIEVTDPVTSLRRAMDALRRHIFLEEEFLFPPMRAELAIPIGVMLREHGEIWRTLDELETELAGSDARDSLLRLCDELVSALDSHNSKEEPIFYTQADASLSPEEGAELKAFLDSGQMPAGWICQASR